MSDHADTIRRALVSVVPGKITVPSVAATEAALAAMDAYEAERQQAQGEIAKLRQEAVATEQLIQRQRGTIETLRAERQQAIDALERAADDLTHIANFAESLSGSDEARRAATRVNAALVKLGERRP